MKRTGSNNSDQNVDLNTADNDIQTRQLAAANYGDNVTAPNDSGKVSMLNRRTLGVVSVLGLLFTSLLAGTLFFTSADDSASSAPNFADKTVSEKTTSTFPKSQPAEFSTASSFNRSVLDPADISNSPKARGPLAPSRNQGVAKTSVAQPSSVNSARSQCSGGDCVSPKRAPVTEVTVKLFKLGVEKLFSTKDPLCSSKKLCSAGDGVLVAGAKFVLYEGATVDEAKKVGEYTVGADGFELSGLQPGTYTLKELTAPDGYEPYPKAVKFTVEKGGRAKYQYSKFTSYFENNEFYFPNLKLPEPEVWLFKLGVADLADCSWGSCSTSTAGSELLDGAEFSLYEGTVLDKAHKVGDNFTVGKDGLKIPGLQAGKTYSLVEVTSPAGYQVNRTDLTFEVDADGKAKYQTDAGSEFFVDNKIFVPNQKAAPPAVKFKLFKLGVADSRLVRNCTVGSKFCSAGDGELVEGAKFALYKGQKVDEANKVGEYTVGKDGLEISDLQVNEYYTLKEVEAPAGYELNETTASLRVKSDGVVGRRVSKIYRDLVDNEFYFPNLKEPIQAIDIALNKVSDKDTPLENVKFDLYEAANPATPIQNLVTDKDGKATLTVMPGGKYRLVETQTVSGYALLPQAIEFQVDANGTVTIDKQNGNVNTVTSGDKTLKVVNYPEGKLPLSGQSGFLVVLLSGLSLLLLAVAISLLGRKRQ